MNTRSRCPAARAKNSRIIAVWMASTRSRTASTSGGFSMRSMNDCSRPAQLAVDLEQRHPGPDDRVRRRRALREGHRPVVVETFDLRPQRDSRRATRASGSGQRPLAELRVVRLAGLHVPERDAPHRARPAGFRAGARLGAGAPLVVGPVLHEVPDDLVEAQRLPHGEVVVDAEVPPQRGGDFRRVPQIDRQPIHRADGRARRGYVLGVSSGLRVRAF